MSIEAALVSRIVEAALINGPELLARLNKKGNTVLTREELENILTLPDPRPFPGKKGDTENTDGK